MLKNKSLCLLVAAVMLAACSSKASANGANWNGNNLTWKDFSSQPAPSMHMDAGQGGLVVFRSAADANKAAVNVSIDGEYLASLLPGGYSQTVVCARSMHITAIETKKDVGYEMKLAHQGTTSQVSEGRITYVQVSSNGGAPVVNVLDETTAKQALQRVRLQTHTLPRVDKRFNCDAMMPMVPAEGTQMLHIRG